MRAKSVFQSKDKKDIMPHIKNMSDDEANRNIMRLMDDKSQESLDWLIKCLAIPHFLTL